MVCLNTRASGYFFPVISFSLLLALVASSSRAVPLAEYVRSNPIKLFVAKKGAVMPNVYDSPGHLQEGTRALLLSGLGLTDLVGISSLMVEHEGKRVPVTSVQGLHLYANNNELETLPDEIGALDNVEFFYCEFNRLKTLPRALAEMDSLIAMYFTGNRFSEIPPFVFNMSRLTKLQFSKNQLTRLPPEIGQMTGLRHFNIAGNQIATLPAGFATMRATIDITGTRIDPAKLSPELRARIGTEKPPGSKDPDAVIVSKPEKREKIPKPVN